jgi:hypothetical protein
VYREPVPLPGQTVRGLAAKGRRPVQWATLVQVTELLVPRPVHAVNVTRHICSAMSDAAGAPIVYDEIDTVSGPRPKEAEDVRTMLNAGHRRGATAGRYAVKGKTGGDSLCSPPAGGALVSCYRAARLAA